MKHLVFGINIAIAVMFASCFTTQNGFFCAPKENILDTIVANKKISIVLDSVFVLKDAHNNSLSQIQLNICYDNACTTMRTIGGEDLIDTTLYEYKQNQLQSRKVYIHNDSLLFVSIRCNGFYTSLYGFKKTKEQLKLFFTNENCVDGYFVFEDKQNYFHIVKKARADKPLSIEKWQIGAKNCFFVSEEENKTINHRLIKIIQD
ncbi:MAG: hypothetical protein JNM36_19590 [Chitinophagales bacterium]|nr:hypothetical protein [Chitinophagales bacterium]